MTGEAATERAVGRKRIAAGEARTVIIRRYYDAAIDDVWEACTDPRRIRRWFLPVSGDLRAGGTFQLEGNAGGEIVRCEPPRLLSLTWRFADRPVDEVELRLFAREDGHTLLELEHASVSDAILNDDAAGLWGLGVGWEMPLILGLPAFLRGELPDAAAVESFEFTPEIEALANRLGAAWEAVARASSTAPPPPE